MRNHIEILAPAGNHEMLAAAVNAGADAVYFGVQGFNMRVSARGFALDDLPGVVKKVHEAGVRAYLTVNTVLYDDELDAVGNVLDSAEKAGVDAVIFWDVSVLDIIREKNYTFEPHLSTQASVSNFNALRFYAAQGVRRFVLARELSLERIERISERVAEEGMDVTLEAFVHGALCVSESGRCFISQFLYGKSANRGECYQPCRKSYNVYEIEDTREKKRLILENRHVMSPDDLCTITFIDRIIKAGVSALKIEGRGRTPEYVAVVTGCYREAVDAYIRNQLTPVLKDNLRKRLETVYNRGFSDGFYFGRPLTDWSGADGNISREKKEYAGKVLNYYRKAGAIDIIIESNTFKMGDCIYIIGPTTGCVREKVDSLRNENNEPVDTARKGMTVGIKVRNAVRENDKVYVIVETY